MERSNIMKIIVAGDGGVGKTSLLDRYINDNFDLHSTITKGIGFFNKKIRKDDIPEEYSAVFWDFGGQKQFRFMLPNFISGCVGAIICFDLTRFNSIIHIDEWMKEFTAQADFPIILVGTKFDLNELMVVSVDDYAFKVVDDYARCVGYMKTSAKDNYNVKETFEMLIDILLDRECRFKQERNSMGKYPA